MTSLKDELAELGASFERMAADLKAGQDKLLAFGRRLERTVAAQSAELTHEKSTRESDVAERTAELTDANLELRRQAVELSDHNREITLLSKMNDFLQTSNTEAEAYSVISETVQQLFPEDSGAVFVLNASRDMLEAAAVWGALPPSNLIFPPGECWAHRRGQVHLAIGQEGRCAHVTDDGAHVHLPAALGPGRDSRNSVLGRRSPQDRPKRRASHDRKEQARKVSRRSRRSRHRQPEAARIHA